MVIKNSMFDGETGDEITNCDKLCKSLKKSKLHISKDIYNAARCKLILNKK